MNSRLSKVLDLRQNNLCDFHLRSSARFSVAVYMMEVATPCIVYTGELQLLVSLRQGAATACTVASGSSHFPYCYIKELQFPVSIVRGVEFCLPDLYQCSSYRLLQGVTVWQLLTLFKWSRCMLDGMGSRYCTLLSNLQFFLCFSVFVGIPLAKSRRSDINLWLEENFNFFSNPFFVAVLSRYLVTCCGFGALLSYSQSCSALSAP